jgi:hypothetical protein
MRDDGTWHRFDVFTDRAEAEAWLRLHTPQPQE